MKISTALTSLQHIAETAGNHRQLRLAIPIHQPGGIGGSPCVEVAMIQAGIDWDASVVFLVPEKHLTALTPEQVVDISKSVSKGSSWHAFQREKGLRDEIKALRELVQRVRADMSPDELQAWCVERDAQPRGCN